MSGEPLDRPPIWLMRQAGRYLPEYRALRERAGGFLELCYTPEFAVEATLQPLRRFPLDAAILFADLPLLADGLGQSLSYREGEGPVLEPIRDGAALARLRPERVHERVAPVYETVRRLRAALPASTALIGFAGAPWTLATYMVEGGGSVEHARAKRWAYADPAGFQQLIDLLTEVTADYLAHQVAAGADVVQLFDSWAGVLPEAAFQRWCLAPVAAIVARLKARWPDLPVIAFPRGAGLLYPGYGEATGIAAVGLDTTVPLATAQRLQQAVTVQGNLDPQLLVVGGAPLRQATATILEALGGGRFIFNLGHGVVPDTPVEHVAALVGQVQAWRR